MNGRMSKRIRWYVVLALNVAGAWVYARIAQDWSDAVLYAGGAAYVAVAVVVGLLWMHMAPDGDLRRRPHG